MPLSGDLELTLGGSVHFTSSFYTQTLISDLVRIRGYAKVDARIALGSSNGRWQLAVIGRNLTDTARAAFYTYMPGATGSVIGEADRPRSVAFQLSTNW
jgi:outer membrane receptor for ferric coprogen and ferric-rhodotorulic acid